MTIISGKKLKMQRLALTLPNSCALGFEVELLRSAEEDEGLDQPALTLKATGVSAARILAYSAIPSPRIACKS